MLGKSYTEFLWIIDDLSQVETYILVDSLTWLPRRMELKAFGGIEIWEFVGWENVTVMIIFTCFAVDVWNICFSAFNV